MPIGEDGFFPPNPNYLRPFVIARNNRREIEQSERTAYRATAYYEYNLADQLESPWLNWLGRGIVTGLLNRQEIEQESYRLRLQHTDPYFARLANQPLGSGFHVQALNLVYVGPAVDLATTQQLSDIQIDPIRGVRTWDTERLVDFDIFQMGIQPGTENERPRGNTAEGAAEILSIANSSPDGLGNFQTITTQMGAYVDRPQKTYEVIDTYAFNLQQFLFRDDLVVTYGYRNDSLELQQASSLDFERDANNAYIFDSVDIRDMTRNQIDVQTSTWGVVGYLPRRWVQLPYNSMLSVHYGESENFRPELGRIDHMSNPLPNPGGTTKEYGFVISVDEDKFMLRMNWYETSLTNVSARTAAGEINNAWIQRTGYAYNRAQEALERFDGSDDDSDYANFVRAGGIVGMAVADAWYDSIPPEVVESFNIRKVFDSRGLVTRVEGDAPAGVSDTQDITSEGWELEGVYNPTRNWRIAFNITKQFATRTNVRPVTQVMAQQLLATLDTPVPGYDFTVGDVPRGGVGYWNPDATGLERFRFIVGETESTLRDWAIDNVLRNVREGVAAEGTQAKYQREWRINLITNYTFRDGFLKGFAVGGAWRYETPAIIGYPSVANEFGDLVPDIENPFKNEARSDFDVWFRYRRKLEIFGGIDWTLQLNIRNLTASDNDFIPVAYHLAGPLQGELARVRAAPPRSFSITSTFRF